MKEEEKRLIQFIEDLNKRKRLIPLGRPQNPNPQPMRWSGGGAHSGVIDKAKSVYKTAKALIYGRDDYPPHVRKFIAENGDKKIVKIRAGKNPIEALTKEKGDILTFGKYSEVLKKHNIDDLYHNWLEIELDDGNKYIIEKNEVVEVVPNIHRNKTQFLDVPISKEVNVKELLKRPLEKRGKDLLKYNMVHSNCQDYVNSVLDDSDLNNKESKEFVKQPTEGIFEEKEFKAPMKIIDTITNVAEKFNIIKEGAGKKRNKKNK